jgi:hypothetical protein
MRAVNMQHKNTSNHLYDQSTTLYHLNVMRDIIAYIYEVSFKLHLGQQDHADSPHLIRPSHACNAPF